MAARGEHTENISELARHGADLNACDAVRAPARARARNADVCAQYGSTPLHQAAFYGKRQSVTLLVRLGADMSARDRVRSATPSSAQP